MKAIMPHLSAQDSFPERSKTAGSLGFCTDPDLEAMGYRKTLFGNIRFSEDGFFNLLRH
jgi:hypothetical protein